MSKVDWASPAPESGVESSAALQHGSRVAVMGGGPAGSFFSIFLLQLSEMSGLDLELDLYEPRDFSKVGPGACNMCGGIISESLVQHLAADGIELPQSVIQRGIDSYKLHMDRSSVNIVTPLDEKRIGAIHRGAGPRGLKEARWDSFDGYLQSIAMARGARHVPERIVEVGYDEGRPWVRGKGGEKQRYELLVVATGVNSAASKVFEKLDIDYTAPGVVRTFIREYHLGSERIEAHLGSAMHVFLLNLPGIEFAAIIPKGDFITVCLLGENIDREVFQSFLSSPEVKSCMPADWEPESFVCQCSPHMSVRGLARPYADRIVFIGDSGMTRLYKDGIGAAYRTAKAAARTAVFHGVSREHFHRHYGRVCNSLSRDNLIGRLVFAVTGQIQKRGFLRRAVLRVVEAEQRNGKAPHMSTVLWDMFTGSASYKDILWRTLHPGFLLNLTGAVIVSVVRPSSKVASSQRS